MDIIFGLIGVGLVMGVSALGSAASIGIAGSASIGAWKRCYEAGKPAPMTLFAFAGADAVSDAGKGLANYIAVIGICETVALFVMVLSMTSLR
jgi:V/A-type H+-transporting ATPase subunit K